jgi:hypothetical protein
VKINQLYHWSFQLTQGVATAAERSGVADGQGQVLKIGKITGGLLHAVAELQYSAYCNSMF